MIYQHYLKSILTLGVGLILSFGAANDTDPSYAESSISISHHQSGSFTLGETKRHLQHNQDRRSLFFRRRKSRPVSYSSSSAITPGNPFSAVSANTPVSLTEVQTNPNPEYTRLNRKGKGRGSWGGTGKGGSSSKGKKGSSSKGKESGSEDNGFCETFDFSDNHRPGNSEGKVKGSYGGKWKGNNNGWRGLLTDEEILSDDKAPVLQPREPRELQFDGEGCSLNVLEKACNNPETSIFVHLLEKAGLGRVFECAGPFTILAPSNAALQSNPFLLEFLEHPYNCDELEDFLLYHIIPCVYPERDFRESGYKTLQGDEVQVSTSPLMFNQAGVIQTDILGCNGIIHVIDDVLITPDNGYLPSECAALDFRRPSEASTHGSGVGLFHRELQYSGHICDLNVLDTARLNPDLSIFVDLIEVAGLEQIFLCAGPFTALVPTNAAFEKIDQETIDELLLPENRAALQDLLLFHMLPGVQFSTIINEGAIPSLSGDDVTVTLDPLKFNSVGVIEADITACNGIIHILEDVLSTDPSTDSPAATRAPSAAPVSAERTTSPTTLATGSPTATTDTPAPTPLATASPTATTDTPAPTPLATASPTVTTDTPAPTTGETGSPTVARTANPTTIAPSLMPSIATSLAPSGSILEATEIPSLIPSTASGEIRVRLTDYYLVYVVELLEETLPEDQLATLITNTQDFYATVFEAFYEGTETGFVGVEITPKEVLFGDELPPAETFNDPSAAWNYFINFDTDVIYEQGSTGIADIPAHFDAMSATTDDYVRYIIEFVRLVPSMASTIQVEFQAVEIIPEVSARIKAEETGEDEVTLQETLAPTSPAPGTSSGTVFPLASVAAAVSAFMTLVAASFLVMKQRQRSSLATDKDRAFKEENALDATVTDETASQGSSRSKLQTREFGADDMETTSWCE